MHAYQGLEGVVLSGCMGLIVGLIFLVSRRLWPIAFAHAAYNFLLGIL